MSVNRIAIVGTAPSWTQTPWTDPNTKILSLNDAYRLKGFTRADEWYDFHPLDKFHLVEPGQAQIFAHTIKPGTYVRPHDHLAWLGRQARTIPVWLHPDYLSQHPDAAGWPRAQAFPKAEIEAHYGRYFTSSPQWMLAHQMMLGYREFIITGIHLATAEEYRIQMGGFCYLLGRLLGNAKTQESVADGFRCYETSEGSLKLPESSPVLRADFQYAFDPKPTAHEEPAKWDVHRFGVKRERAVTALRDAKWWHRKAPLSEALWRADAYLVDAQEQLSRLHLQQQIASM